MSAFTLFNVLFEMPISLDVLLNANLLFPKQIKSNVYIGPLNILIEPLSNGKRYFEVTKHGLIEIVIQKHTSHVELKKNGMRLVLLNAINNVKNECFGAISTIILKVLLYFGRRNEVQSIKRAIELIFYPLFMIESN